MIPRDWFTRKAVTGWIWASTEFTFPGWGPWEPEWWSDYDSPAKLAASWGYCGA